jgi:hypothetical protein
MRLEWTILANYAEANGGLLYISGAGWDTVTVGAPLPPGAPVPEGTFTLLQGTLVIRLNFHQTETGRDHTFRIAIMDEDGGEIGAAEGGFRVDLAPGLPGAWQQPVNLPVPVSGVPIPRPGIYSISVQVDEQHMGDRPFRVLKGY